MKHKGYTHTSNPDVFLKDQQLWMWDAVHKEMVPFHYDSSTNFKPVGSFGNMTDLVLRFRGGQLVAADTGDQGGGQN